MRKIFLVVVLINLTSCKSQVKENENVSNKNKSMEYFNINKYKNLEVDEKYSPSSRDLYFKDGKKRIQILYLNEDIKVEETNTDNAYKQVKVYLKRNNVLQFEGKYFYSFQIGTDKQYDENGNIINEINHDLEFKLTIEDLAKIMKEKYNMDIYNIQKTYNINRYFESQKTNLHLYLVCYRDEIKQGIVNCYFINAFTGKVLYTTTRFADTEEKQVSLYYEFIKSYK